MSMVVKTYQIINKLPNEEKFCIGSQMRNCSVSVPSNIAEGHARNSTKEFIHHLNFSKGSFSELETQLLLCEMLGFIKMEEIQPIIDEIHVIDTMITRLIESLKRKLK